MDLKFEIESLVVGQFYHSQIDGGWLVKRLEDGFELLEIPEYGGDELFVGFFNLNDIVSLLKVANSLT